jgi:hypothetical protein
MMEHKEFVYLDSYILQQDMRIRLPKQIINNMKVVKGETLFDIFLDSNSNELLLRVSSSNIETKGNVNEQ